MNRRLQTTLFVGLSLIGLAGFAWPFVIPGIANHGGNPPQWAALLVLLLLPIVGLLFLQLGGGGMGPKAIALLGVLGATMVALRLPGFVFGFNMLFIVVLVGGNSFGPRFGFLLGAIGIFASGLFLGGFGPWLPFQMVATGWVGMGAGLLPHSGRWSIRLGALAVYGWIVGMLYGAVMNLYFWPLESLKTAVDWDPSGTVTSNMHHYATFYVTTSLPWDIWGSIGNTVLVLLLGRAALGTLDRAAKRMRLDIVPVIGPAVGQPRTPPSLPPPTPRPAPSPTAS